MTEHEQVLHDVREEINGLPVTERAEVLRIAGILRAAIADNPLGMMALALLGAELACHNGTALDVPQKDVRDGL